MNPALLVADTETTGATPEDKIVEIAWLEVDDNMAVLREFCSRIDPQRPISASASGVHGITNEDVADAPTIEEYFTEVPGVHVPDEIVLIGHNIRFDRRYLEPTMPTKIVDTLCTLRLARKYLPDAENHKLTTLSFQYGLYRGHAHSALDDAKTCLDLLRFVVALSGKTLRELVVEGRDPQWVNTMPFGKHKDVPMRDLDRSYARWATTGGMKDLDVDLEYTLKRVAKGDIPA